MTNMATIKYKIEFFSDWHCGSGLAAGADLDLLAIRDKNGMPFVPGKTMKGLVREATENYIQFKDPDQEIPQNLFGIESKQDIDEAASCMFFSNANLARDEYETIVAHRAQEFMFRKKASTSIDADGIAQNHTLRKIQTVIPCTLVGEMINVPDEWVGTIEKSFGFIKHMGLNRNRGLGRCKITKID